MTVSRRLEIISSRPPMDSNVVSMLDGGMISPAICDSYSSRSSAASCSFERPDWESRLSPFSFFLDGDGSARDERT